MKRLNYQSNSLIKCAESKHMLSKQSIKYKANRMHHQMASPNKIQAQEELLNIHPRKQCRFLGTKGLCWDLALIQFTLLVRMDNLWTSKNRVLNSKRTKKQFSLRQILTTVVLEHVVCPKFLLSLRKYFVKFYCTRTELSKK